MLRRFVPSSNLKFSSFSCCGVLRFCSTTTEDQQQQPIYAGHLRVHHDSPGTGRFIAHGYGKPKSQYEDIVSIVATCDISDRMLGLQEYLKDQQKSANSLQQVVGNNTNHSNNSSTTNTNNNNSMTKKLWRLRRELTSPMSEDDEASRVPPPINFTIYLENALLPSLISPSSEKQQQPGSGVCLIASCLSDSTLSIDGLSFVKSVRHALDRSVTSVMDRRDNYQGPQLHQGLLAECSFSANFNTPNPIYPPRQHRLLSLRPNFNAKYSPYARYGAHFPVHTIQPELYDAIHSWCSDMGIDDKFAADMRKIAMETADREMKSWKRHVMELLVVNGKSLGGGKENKNDKKVKMEEEA